MPKEPSAHVKTLCSFRLLLHLNSSVLDTGDHPSQRTPAPPLWGAWRKFDCSISCISARRSSILKVWGARDTRGAFWSWRNSATNCQERHDDMNSAGDRAQRMGDWGGGNGRWSGGLLMSNTSKGKKRNYRFGNTQTNTYFKASRRNKANLVWPGGSKDWDDGEPSFK